MSAPAALETHTLTSPGESLMRAVTAVRACGAGFCSVGGVVVVTSMSGAKGVAIHAHDEIFIWKLTT